MKKADLIPITKDINYAVNKAVEIFNKGGVFSYPTDTIYGMGGNPLIPGVSEKISRIKQRDAAKNFIYLVASVENLYKFAETPDIRVQRFIEKMIPKPITIILNLREEYKSLLNKEDAAFRIPDEDFCKKLLNQLLQPIISTSANKAEKSPLNRSDEIINEFGDDLEAIFYYEKERKNRTSTIISLERGYPILVREGAVSFDEILNLFKFVNETF